MPGEEIELTDEDAQGLKDCEAIVETGEGIALASMGDLLGDTTAGTNDLIPGDLGQLNADLAMANATIETLTADLATANTRADTLSGDLSTANSKISQLNGELSTANSKVDQLTTNIGLADTKLAELTGDLAAEKTKNAQLEKDLAAAKANPEVQPKTGNKKPSQA